MLFAITECGEMTSADFLPPSPDHLESCSVLLKVAMSVSVLVSSSAQCLLGRVKAAQTVTGQPVLLLTFEQSDIHITSMTAFQTTAGCPAKQLWSIISVSGTTHAVQCHIKWDTWSP